MLRRSVGFVVEHCVICILVRLLQSHSHAGPGVICILERFTRTWPLAFFVCNLPYNHSLTGASEHYCRIGSNHEAS